MRFLRQLDFFAADGDVRTVLDFVFSDLGCRLFEEYSRDGQQPREFRSTRDMMTSLRLGRCDVSARMLMLLAPDAGGHVSTRSYVVRERRESKLRHLIQGWGLIQLHLGGIGARGLIPSYSNVNSEKRAQAWESHVSGMGAPGDWNWKGVERTFRELKKFVRGMSVDRDTRPRFMRDGTNLLEDYSILPEAAHYLRGGVMPANWN